MKRRSLNPILIFCVCCGLMLPALRSSAFSLLGPYESWMQPSNGFRAPVDYYYGGPGVIGGPMCISNGYRWNVPVVTYGFDQSFLNFFGTNGVAAVEGAIQILNDLPPASGIVLSNYPDYSLLVNAAASQSLYDLKSQTLSLLLEHLGLASPTRYVFTLRQWSPIFEDYFDSSWWQTEGMIPQYVVMRNFDPLTLAPSQWINGNGYYGQLWAGFSINVNLAEVVMEDDQFYHPLYSAVADNQLEAGDGFAGLTSDDVGGLCY